MHLFSCYLSRSSQPDKSPVILQLNLSSFHPLMLSNINFVKRLLHSANSNSAAILKLFPQAFKMPCKERQLSNGQKDWHAYSLHSGCPVAAACQVSPTYVGCLLSQKSAISVSFCAGWGCSLWLWHCSLFSLPPVTPAVSANIWHLAIRFRSY